MSLFRDIFYPAPDGLRLHVRDYFGAPTGKTPVLCLPGLTRNARDFEGVAVRLAASHRVIVAELRGRGQSAYDPDPAQYQPSVYVADMMALLDHLALPKVALIGTSLGGLMAMGMGAGWPDRFAGILLNDVGPEVAAAGIEKIRGYIDRIPDVRNWSDAARDLQVLFGSTFPRYGAPDWDKFARQVYRENDQGVPTLDFDPAIAVNIKQGPTAAPDLWPIFDVMPKIPLAVIRGRLSNILSVATLAEMIKHRPDLLVVELDDVGHAPNLEEPESVTLIDRFLSLVEERVAAEIA